MSLDKWAGFKEMDQKYFLLNIIFRKNGYAVHFDEKWGYAVCQISPAEGVASRLGSEEEALELIESLPVRPDTLRFKKWGINRDHGGE